MRVYIIIPFHNEENTLSQMLDSLASQTKRPHKVVLVNDNSSDKSNDIANDYCTSHDWISKIDISSSDEHIPGSKVINAFYKGLEKLDDNFDIVCKFDADIILPTNYMEAIVNCFAVNPKMGIASGLLFIEKDGTWQFENIASKTHVRGPIKAYRKACFETIGGLKKTIGWDTIDTLLAQYHDWEIYTQPDLIVKHLKPTGKAYSKNTQLLAGERWYQMRYGILLTIIASAKSALQQKSLRLFLNSIKGYYAAKKNPKEPAVSLEEGKFIRTLRWNGIRKKFF
ncbi:MAG: glycosyltransferase [bacterium]